MVDRKVVARELAEARAVRLAAEDAWCDMEELLWKAQRGPRFWRRIAVEVASEHPPSLRR